MSTRQRIAHVTGLNVSEVGWLPQVGASFAIPGGGAPGVLSGPDSGFSVAVGYHLAPSVGNAIWDGRDDGGAAGDASLSPQVEYLVGSFVTGQLAPPRISVRASQGETEAGVSVGLTSALLPQDADVILLMSFIPDASLYYSGWAAESVMQSMVNGDFIRGPSGTDRNFALTGAGENFVIGGLPLNDIGPAPNGVFGGCYNSSISSVWVTPGIPTIRQAVQFMDASMEAGVVVPQPFNPPRQLSGVPTTAPSEPEGCYWNAADLPSQLELGTPWVDRISGLELQLIGTQLGAARVMSRSPFYTLDPSLND